jgi:hypothetical protein
MGKFENFELFLEKNSSKIKYGEKNIIKDEWIEYVENNLSFKLPNSYKWFLKKYEFLEIGYENIKIIAPPEFQEDADIDILYTYKNNLENRILSSDKISIMENDDEIYYFLIENGIENNEYKIHLIDHISQSESFYANNFIDFITLKINSL